VTEQEFTALAAACDRLLRAPDTSLARLAIPSLHVVCEHPDWLARYASLHDPARDRDPVRRLFDGGRRLARIARAVARSGRVASHDAVPQDGPGRVDVLLLSHLSTAAQLESEDDFYFGGLERLLCDRGLTSLLLLVNHGADGCDLAARAMRPGPRARRLLPTTVPPAEEARLWRACVQARADLKPALRSADAMDRAVAALARRDSATHGTAANLRLHLWIERWCRAVQPRMVITTYEGDSSERVVWHAARRAVPGTLCVGYQHTRLFPRSHAIRRAVSAPGHPCDPDVVLTTGEQTRDDLAASGAVGATRFIVYGTHRRTVSGCEAASARPARCLVLPEASEREAAVLFGFALACAPLAPDVTFVLRPHPLTEVERLRERLPVLRAPPPNVVMSGASLDHDCAGARDCLYRGSSAAIFAVLAGLKPFYFARPGELTIDPLHGLADWRETVTTPEAVVARLGAPPDPRDADAAARARAWCDQIMRPVRSEAIDELIALLGPRP
jgi:hypothetical protein